MTAGAQSSVPTSPAASAEASEALATGAFFAEALDAGVETTTVADDTGVVDGFGATEDDERAGETCAEEIGTAATGATDEDETRSGEDSAFTDDEETLAGKGSALAEDTGVADEAGTAASDEDETTTDG